MLATDATPGFGWWEIASERRRLHHRIKAARYWIQNADPSTPELYAHGLMNAIVLLEEAEAMCAVEGFDVVGA